MTDRAKGIATFRIPLVIAGVMFLLVGAAIHDLENLPNIAGTFQWLGGFALLSACVSRMASHFDEL